VTVANLNTLPPSELKELVRASYGLVLAKLPAKSRTALSNGRSPKKAAKKKATMRSTRK